MNSTITRIHNSCRRFVASTGTGRCSSLQLIGATTSNHRSVHSDDHHHHRRANVGPRMYSSNNDGTYHVMSNVWYKRCSLAPTFSLLGVQQQLLQIRQKSSTIFPTPSLRFRLSLPSLRLQEYFQITLQRRNHSLVMKPSFHFASAVSQFKIISNDSSYGRMSSSTLTDVPVDNDTSKKSSTNSTENDKKKKSNGASGSSSSSNIFLDNLGTMFLIFIGSIIGWLVRSYYNGVRKNTVRTTLIESTAHADPIELDELRLANTELTPSVFTEIIQHIIDQQMPATTTDGEIDHEHSIQSSSSSSTNRMTYPEFIFLVRTAMMKKNGEAFTIQCGHIIDRVVLAALIKYENNKNGHDQKYNRLDSASTDLADPTIDDKDNHTTLVDKIEMPIEFWLTVLSLALYSSAKERIEILHSVCHQFATPVPPPASESEPTMISMTQVIQLIGYLQDTCQLVPDAQIIMTSHKYPLQEYIVGTPEQMIDHQQWDTNDEKNKNKDPDVASFKGNNITVGMLSDILTSRSVCAWGECYKYKSK